MVSSLNIKLLGEQIRSVIRAIDLDGGGYIDFPEFEAAVKRHEDVRRKKLVCAAGRLDQRAGYFSTFRAYGTQKIVRQSFGLLTPTDNVMDQEHVYFKVPNNRVLCSVLLFDRGILN